jgi:hypothetical protein
MQFPKPYIFDADGNLAGPVRHLKGVEFKYDSGLVDDDNKPVTPFNRWNHMTKCITAAVKDPDVETIILDSLSAWSEYAKDDIKRQRGLNPMAKNAPSVNETNRGIIPLIQQEWDTFAFYFTNLITNLKGCGKSVIITAHHELKTDAQDIMRDFICVQGRMRSQISGMFGDVWNTYIKSAGMGDKATYTRMLRVVPTNGMDQRGLKKTLDFPPTFPADMGYIKSKLEWK